jgi:hypothetical protein
MRVVCTKEALPHRWKDAYHADASLLLERDLPVGSLFLKLLVFKDPKSLRRFWKRAAPLAAGGPLPKSTLGVVAKLSYTVCDYDKSQWPEPYMETDRRYFAAMCLVMGHLGIGVITHESVHAAFNHAARLGTRRGPWAKEAEGDSEELVCYPAGQIARLVTDALYNAECYKNEKKAVV